MMASRTLKILLISGCAVVALVFSLKATAIVSGDGAVILAQLVAFLLWLSGVFLTSLTGWFEDLLQDGDGSIVQQVAANTVAVQSTLYEHAHANHDIAIANLRGMGMQEGQRMFGVGNVTVEWVENGEMVQKQYVTGAVSPTACQARSEGIYFDAIKDKEAYAGTDYYSVGSLYEEITFAADSKIKAHGDLAQSFVESTEGLLSLEQPNLGFEQDILPSGEFDQALDSILYATNPMRMPDVDSDSVIAKDYRLRAQLHQEMTKVPQQVLVRQLKQRVSLANSAEGEPLSEFSLLMGFGDLAVDPDYPNRLDTKTDTGQLREVNILLSRLNRLQVEQLRSEQETNQLLAIESALALREENTELYQQYVAAQQGTNQ